MEQFFDAAKPLRDAQDAARALGEALDGAAAKADALAREREVRIRVTTEEPATVGQGRPAGGAGAIGVPGGALALPPAPLYTPAQRWDEAPSWFRFHGTRLPGDTPADFSGATSEVMASRASEYWDKIRAGGAYHTMRHAGDFSLKGWDQHLGDEEKAQHKEFLSIAASGAGMEYAKSTEGLERAGARIARFLAEIAKGGDTADKAKEGLAKAREELEALGRASDRALAAMPDGKIKDELAAEAKKLREDAANGQRPGKDAPGGDKDREAEEVSGRALLNMARNPNLGGALETLVGKGLDKIMAGNGAMAGVLGGTAAVAGGIYAGWKFTDDRADRRIQDALRAREDARISYQMGGDVRGLFWQEGRNAVVQGVNALEGTEALMGMASAGVSMRESRWGGKAGLLGVSQYLAQYAPMLGMSAGEAGQLVGTAKRSGALGENPNEVYGYLKRISYLIERGADAGIASRETLQAIASLNAAQVEALGKLSPGQERWNEAAVSLLNKSGDPSLQGAQGAKVLAGLGGSKTEHQMAMALRAASIKDPNVINDLISGSASTDEERRRLTGMSMADKIAMIQEDPALLRELTLRALKSGAFEGVPLSLLQGMLGGQIGTRRMSSLIHSGLSPEAIKAEEAKIAHEGRRDPGTGAGTSRELMREAQEGFSGSMAKALADLQRSSSLSLEAAQGMKEASAEMKQAAYQMGTAMPGGGDSARMTAQQAASARGPSAADKEISKVNRVSQGAAARR